MICIVKITRFCRNTFMLKENLKREKSRAFGSAYLVWLRTLNEIRTFFRENPNAEFWRFAPPPLADARSDKEKFCSRFFICARPIFSSKRKTKLFFGGLLFESRAAGRSVKILRSDFRGKKFGFRSAFGAKLYVASLLPRRFAPRQQTPNIQFGSGGRIRTYNPLLNRELRYHCATPE